MSNIFKVTRLMRGIALLGVTVFCLSFGGYIYESYKGMPIENGPIDLAVQLLIGLLFGYCAIAFNKEEYEIADKGIIVRSFLTKDKLINLSEIKKIELVKIWPFSFIKIFFNNGRVKNILPLDNQKEFYRIIESRLASI